MIVGGGKVGLYLASLLLSGGHQVKVIEIRKEQISHLLHELSQDVIIHGNGTDPNLLESARTIVFWAAAIIFLLSCASIILVVVNPKSRSITSTPKNNLLHANTKGWRY